MQLPILPGLGLEARASWFRAFLPGQLHFGLVSYPITLSYEDTNTTECHPDSAMGSALGAAVVTRTWGAQDWCATHGTQVQPRGGDDA